ncbi:SDR family NAD(P)-dependent oxidoreductase [Hyphococcus luteus]|uniref:Short-chain dehydrogenase n=1 Tax=Hyphococcus luteus TaxID=2058213 RepID=A0A2S7K0F5_9PROT|nr:SDR family NAD(P)-dependent oxidoreductase [Marinicaulis flavus]PQA85987.1 short-chain dehydrogenase [Marinicaulis flavus]
MANNMDRVVIVTGAGKGLGCAFALRIAEDGAAVVVNNRIRDGQPDSASAVVEEAKAAGARATANRLDVRDPQASKALVDQALAEFGRLDAVVFNAGVNGDAVRFADMRPDAFDEVMATNFFAPMRLAHAAWPHLAKSDAGRMLFVSSTAGLYGVRGRSPYASSKGALCAFAATLAHEGRRDGIGVNILMPYAATQMTGGDDALDGMLPADSVAPLASWLVSPECETAGDTWIAGAGYACKAQVLETEGDFLEEDIGAVLARRGVSLGDFAPPLGSLGAEKAFEAFMARAAGRRNAG